jgi:hypothetical protein
MKRLQEVDSFFMRCLYASRRAGWVYISIVENYLIIGLFYLIMFNALVYSLKRPLFQCSPLRKLESMRTQKF